MARFPKSDIISLIGAMPRYDLGESVGPDLRLSDVLDPAQPSFGDMALGIRHRPRRSAAPQTGRRRSA